ncbi:hypothetical protein [Streptomyces sp. enrichment culture]|uniref:hypothetical protein n=1 Tax=Streptomyces sp. enrichment culture TaxID=1795815 RepID=UPI003F54DB16
MDLDEGMLDYFREIADVLVSRFDVSRAEAVARINASFEGMALDPYPDLMCHELPEYWAYGLYFEPRDGQLPYSGPCEDLSRWDVRPAPPAGSRVWTLEAQ